ncbi:MAG TPA: hypothetical protein VJ793_17880 [Anaerolineae bacterium]|nr:hypothetical protein [Anaerolineae bacterium]
MNIQIIVLMLVVLVIGGGALALCWISRRWPVPASADADATTGPIHLPDDLPPAIAGVLDSDGARPHWRHALGTLLDLMRRGVVRLEEPPRRMRQGPGDFVIHLRSSPIGLRPHERSLLEVLFGPGDGAASGVRLSDLRPKLSSHWKTFSESVTQEMQMAGLLSRERVSFQKRLLLCAAALLALGVGGLAACLAQIGRWPPNASIGGWGVWPFLVPINLIAAGGLVFIIAAAFPTLSDEGLQRAKRWRRFVSHLHYLAHRYPPAPRPDLIEMCLPYAASYGLAGMWAARFPDGHLSEVAAWFDPFEYGGWPRLTLSGAGNTHVIAALLPSLTRLPRSPLSEAEIFDSDPRPFG